MTYHQKNRGFTLIELLVVIAIIGLVSGVITQNVTASRSKARDNIRLNQIDQIHKALEISATSGTNKLPYSGSSNWACLGSMSPCAGGDIYSNTTVNNAIAGGISGGTVSSIPRDPLFTSGIGDAYLYNSDLNPTASGNCTTAPDPITCPRGAYLAWVVENITMCGRGIHWIDPTNGPMCILRIGDAVTS